MTNLSDFEPVQPVKKTFPNAAFRHSWQTKKKNRQWKHNRHPLYSHADVFKLTCYWGSGTSPPSWSWGHPRSWLHSHTEPQTESPLQENKKRSDVVVRVWKRWTVWMKIFIVVWLLGLFVCLTHGLLLMLWQRELLPSFICSDSFQISQFMILMFTFIYKIQFREKNLSDLCLIFKLIHRFTQRDVIYSIFPNTSLADFFLLEVLQNLKTYNYTLYNL